MVLDSVLPDQLPLAYGIFQPGAMAASLGRYRHAMESRQPDDPAPRQRTFWNRFGFVVRHFARRPLLLAGMVAWTGCSVFLEDLIPRPLSAAVFPVFFFLGVLFFYPSEIDR
jgi:hypothetical protein